ncbi:MAG: hypothetical protein E7675_04695 [Ruminococcaceae bacterium]|nr:hypothetical protein [Oscillospiraceae bacterium]
MKKSITAVLLFFLCLNFISCNNTDISSVVICSNNDYRIERNGNYNYIVLSKELKKHSKLPDDICIRKPTLIFESIEEMRDRFLNGKFSEEEKQTLAKFNKDKDGNIQTFNFDVLYEPVVPEDGKVEIYVSSGFSYTANVFSEKYDDCLFQYYTKEQFDDMYQRRCVDYLAEIKATAFEITNEQQTTTIYHYKNGEEYTTVFYEIKTDDSTLTIFEGYSGFATQETIPDSIAIYGITNEFYYTYRFGYFNERPSIEWLSQFGVEPVKFE